MPKHKQDPAARPIPQNGLEHVLLLREASSVKRMHTMRMHAYQDLASHSWGVAMLILELKPDASAALLRAALVHDLHELETGDVPSPAKWRNANLETALRESEIRFDAEWGTDAHAGITETEWALLKWCDFFELALTCYEEFGMGNKYAGRILDRILGVLAKRTHTAAQSRLIKQLNELSTSGDVYGF